MIVEAADRLNTVKEYYFVRKLEEIKKLNEEGKDIISFGVGSPDLEPSESTIAALVDTANQSNAHGYQMYRGIPELRNSISEWYRNVYGVDLNPENEILPLMGSKEGILHLTFAYINQGDEVLVPNPGYPTYTSVSNLAQASIKYYDLVESNHWYPDFDALANQDLSKVKIMWVNYPHMPTGAPANKNVFDKLVRFAHDHQILICHDNPYSLVLNQSKPISILNADGAKEVAVELNSLSKSHNMAGWRVGMMVGAEEYLNTALRVKSNIDSGMFLGIQKAAVEAFKNSDSWHQERNKVYSDRKEWVLKIYDLLGLEYDPSHTGMFVWGKPSEKSKIKNVIELVDALLYESRVFFTPGMIFGSNGEGYMRASLCVKKEKMEEAYHRIKDWYEKI